MRAHTTSPNPRRASVAPRSPIRTTKSDQPSTSPTYTFADTPHPKAHSPTPVPATTIPILSPKPAQAEVPAAEKQKREPGLAPLTNPTPEQVSAAEKIQEAYRAHAARTHALKSISTLRTRFLAAKAAFALPTTLDYETPVRAADGTETRAHVTVTVDPVVALPSPALSTTDEDPFAHVPKLAYTPTNAPLHAYEEELSRILSALDAVESRGDAGVRAARRELARMVEREAERVERWR
ncbi:uncharacterized protein TRAVEDRAFT_127811, partial [Trametes versicolor FP-101664 SS1]|uniref:uncharacterized protein n=1 Tax=Trametes versicolor (strain FP-101664) TaxID=717944 RepID=UPI0004621E9A